MFKLYFAAEIRPCREKKNVSVDINYTRGSMPFWTIKYSPIWRVMHAFYRELYPAVYIFKRQLDLNTHVSKSCHQVTWPNTASIWTPIRLVVEAINYVRHTAHQNSLQIRTDRVTSKRQLLACDGVIHRWGKYCSEGNTGAYLIVWNGFARYSQCEFSPRKYVRASNWQPRRATIRGFQKQGAREFEQGRCQAQAFHTTSLQNSQGPR